MGCWQSAPPAGFLFWEKNQKDKGKWNKLLLFLPSLSTP